MDYDLKNIYALKCIAIHIKLLFSPELCSHTDYIHESMHSLMWKGLTHFYLAKNAYKAIRYINQK